MKLTKELLHPRGHGHNKAEVEALGLRWPPKSGWIQRLVGAEISEAQYAKFLEAGKREPQHVSHNLTLAPELRQLTVADLKRAVFNMNIPDSAKLKTAQADGWRQVMSLSYCRETNEVSLW